MAINNYIELSAKLLIDYLQSLYPTNVNYQKIDESSTSNLIKWSIHLNSVKPILDVNICTMNSSDTILMNVIYPTLNNKIDNVLINWKNDLQSIEFPIDEKNVSTELITSFNDFIKTRVSVDQLTDVLHDELEKKVLQESESNFAIQQQQDKGHPPDSPPNEKSKINLNRFNDESIATNRRIIQDRPEFEDELEIHNSMNPALQNKNGFPSIGDRDLNPPGLSKNPPMKSFIDPLSDDVSNDGGMYPTMNHPLFRNGNQIGGGGTTSRLGVPPGARFDDPYSEDNLDDLGSGLPGNLRRGPGNFPSNGGFGSGGLGDGGFGGFGGANGGGYGGGFGF